jgi:hypothetical protein
MRPIASPLCVLFLVLAAGCQAPSDDAALPPGAEARVQALVDQYRVVRLDPDISGLSGDQRRAVALLIEAADALDGVFWEQAYGDGDSLLAALGAGPLADYATINFGPYDRLDGNAPFVDGYEAKPVGANYYPADMTDDEFEAAAEIDPALRSLYTMVRRDVAGDLVAIPYHEYFAEEFALAASKLREAAPLVENESFRRYLLLRAEALESGEYQASDLAWMDVTGNDLELVVGPIETYEDQRYGAKAAAETFVLLKDQEWSERLTRYAALLPGLQRGLPVPEAYKSETPGSDSDLGAYDVLYVSGDANAGSKTIAINLPNDEEVQLQKGTRRLQLKNAMRAKFDHILAPIADMLIAEDQRDAVTFDAFFGNTMFHEVARGLGIKQVIDGSGTVREALGNHASALEEGKADVLGLYMIGSLIESGEWDGDAREHLTTFVASIFRSIRFGVSSAHGRANLIRFNFLMEQGAIMRDDETGTYRIDYDRLREAADALSARILTLQGNGDYDAVDAFVQQYLVMPDYLQADLDRLAEAGIPTDIVYEQGPEVLGL